jgi:glycosyltransferase involved in cell wall biosynthesis
VKQTYQNLEIIIVDDASTDRSGLNCVQEFNDTRIRFIQRETNGGSAAARNTGIRAATGQIIAFLDADDMLMENSVAKRVAILQRFAFVGIVCSYTYVVYGEWAVKHYKKYHECYAIKEGKLVPSPTGMIRKSLIDQYGFFDERIWFNEDREFWGRMIVTNKIPTIKLAIPTAYYRKHDSNKLSTMHNADMLDKLKTNDIIPFWKNFEYLSDASDALQLINILKTDE